MWPNKFWNKNLKTARNQNSKKILKLKGHKLSRFFSSFMILLFFEISKESKSRDFSREIEVVNGQKVRNCCNFTIFLYHFSCNFSRQIKGILPLHFHEFFFHWNFSEKCKKSIFSHGSHKVKKCVHQRLINTNIKRRGQWVVLVHVCGLQTNIELMSKSLRASALVSQR